MAEVKKYGLTRLGSKPGKFKRLVKKHLGSKGAEKIDGSDGDKIMAIAKKQNNTNLYKQGSFIKNFYGKEEVMNEDKDYEGDMAKAQLDAIADKASELSDMLDDEDELEAWVQSKITKAKDYINAVYDNMMYDDDDLDEAFKLDPAAKARDDEMKKFLQSPAFQKKAGRSKGEDKSVTKKVAAKDSDATHVGSTGHEHIYAGSQPDRGTHVYHIHNTKTGKTHTAAISHSGSPQSHNNVHRAFGGDSKVSKSASMIAHNDHRSELKESINESYDDHMEKASDHAIQADYHRELAKDAARSGSHDAGAHHQMAADLHKAAAKKYERAADSGTSMSASVAKTAGKKANQQAQKAKRMFEDFVSHADFRNLDKEINEEADYKVNVEGLPTFFMTGSSAEDIKKKLRMMLKKTDMIQSVDRVTKADVKKAFRMKGMGKDEELDEDIERRADTKRVKVRLPNGRYVWRNQRKEIEIGKQVDEARRGRPSSDQEDGMENLMIQLNKVITLRGQKPVEFANGKKVTMKPQTAQMVLNKIKGTKDGAKRQQMMNRMAKSPEDMKAVMREQVELTEEQITVGDYQTKNFDICPSAVSLYKKLKPNDLVVRTAKMHDILFGMEKKAIEADTATKDEVDAAQKLADQIMKMAKMMGKEQEHNYVQSHVDKMKELAGMQEAIDPVNKKAVKKDFDDRMDKDIDNDGDVDASDRYLHKRRKAVTKAIHAVKKNNK